MCAYRAENILFFGSFLQKYQKYGDEKGKQNIAMSKSQKNKKITVNKVFVFSLY